MVSESFLESSMIARFLFSLCGKKSGWSIYPPSSLAANLFAAPSAVRDKPPHFFATHQRETAKRPDPNPRHLGFLAVA